MISAINRNRDTIIINFKKSSCETQSLHYNACCKLYIEHLHYTLTIQEHISEGNMFEESEEKHKTQQEQFLYYILGFHKNEKLN